MTKIIFVIENNFLSYFESDEFYIIFTWNIPLCILKKPFENRII